MSISAHSRLLGGETGLLPSCRPALARERKARLTEGGVLQRRTGQVVAECAEEYWPGRADPGCADVVVHPLRREVRRG